MQYQREAPVASGNLAMPTPACVSLDAAALRITTGAHGGSFSFGAHVPNWRPGARIRVQISLLQMGGGNEDGPGPRGWLTASGAMDSNDARCEDFCTYSPPSPPPPTKMDTAWYHPDPRATVNQTGYCHLCRCAACTHCAKASGLSEGQGCGVPGQLQSCFGARIIQHEKLGEAILRLGAVTTNRDFGCTVTLPAGASYAPPDLSCLDLMEAPSPEDSPPASRVGPDSASQEDELATCQDYRPSDDGHPSKVWYDKRGPNFDCWWYANGGAPQKDGCAAAGFNFGVTAGQACCACGGGFDHGRGCDLAPSVSMKPRPNEGALLEVSLKHWRAGALVLVHFGEDALEKQLSVSSDAVWDAQWEPEQSVTSPADERERRDAFLAFRLSDDPPRKLTPTGMPAFSFLLPARPDMARITVSCDKVIIPSPQRPPPSPPSPSPNPPPPPHPPPLPLALRRECAYLLRPPHAQPLSSASFWISPQTLDGAVDAKDVQTCERGLHFGVEYSRDGGTTWSEVVGSHPNAGPEAKVLVEDLRCGDEPTQRCNFRIRPVGWGESSRGSVAVASLALPARPAGAERLELTFRLGNSGNIRLSNDAGQKLLISDLTASLGSPDNTSIRIVEVRESTGRAAAVVDVLPSPRWSAKHYAAQLALQFKHPGSPIRGGDVTQYLDWHTGVLQLIEHAEWQVKRVAPALRLYASSESATAAPTVADDGSPGSIVATAAITGLVTFLAVGAVAILLVRHCRDGNINIAGQRVGGHSRLPVEEM